MKKQHIRKLCKHAIKKQIHSYKWHNSVLDFEIIVYYLLKRARVRFAGPAVAQLVKALRPREVPGSIPGGSLEIFKWPIPSVHFLGGKMRPVPAVLDVPNVKVKTATQHSIPFRVFMNSYGKSFRRGFINRWVAGKKNCLVVMSCTGCRPNTGTEPKK